MCTPHICVLFHYFCSSPFYFKSFAPQLPFHFLTKAALLILHQLLLFCSHTYFVHVTLAYCNFAPFAPRVSTGNNCHLNSNSNSKHVTNVTMLHYLIASNFRSRSFQIHHHLRIFVEPHAHSKLNKQNLQYQSKLLLAVLLLNLYIIIQTSTINNSLNAFFQNTKNHFFIIFFFFAQYSILYSTLTQILNTSLLWQLY